MNYKIITDEAKLQEFVDWLPELAYNEMFYCCLFARSKYVNEKDPETGKAIKHIKSDKQQLKRFTATKERLIDKIRQCEVKVGSYVQYSHETQDRNSPFIRTAIPQECLAMYINPNPRDLEKATKQGLKKFADLVTKPYGGYNPQAEIMSEIQKSKGNKVYFDIDIDGVSYEDVRGTIDGFVNKEAVNVLNTRGGFHLLLELKKIAPEYVKTWYRNITALPYVDIIEDLEGGEENNPGGIMIPIPGTFQGGYTPNFIKIAGNEY